MTPEKDQIKKAKEQLEGILEDWTSIIPQDFIRAGIEILEEWSEEEGTERQSDRGRRPA